MTKTEMAEAIVKANGNCDGPPKPLNCETCPICKVCEACRVFQISTSNWDATVLLAAKVYLEENNS